MEKTVVFRREDLVEVREKARRMMRARHPDTEAWHQWVQLANACTLLLDGWLPGDD